MTPGPSVTGAGGQAGQSLVISATFTADPVGAPLEYVLRLIGLPSVVQMAPYNQVFQQLLDPSSPLAANAASTSVLLVRLEDFVREVDAPDSPDIRIAKIAEDLFGAIQAFRQRPGASTVLMLFPPSPKVTGDLASAIRNANAELTDRIGELQGISVLRPEEVFNDGGALAGYDPLSDQLAHVPFTDESFATLALAIGRKVHALHVPAHKVLVLDCDNTIWQGVVGEDGSSGIALTEAASRIQQFAVEVQSKGVLICLASKNAERDVLEVLETRQDMVLRAEHIISHRINWDPKPSNLVSLARELNLGLDAFVFLDDNPVECAQMRSELPQVVTLQVPNDGDVESFLKHLWVFDKVTVTEEDAKRTRMYRENTARQQFEDATGDIGQFLAELNLVVEVAPPEEHDWARLAQLSQRTNQFNFTTVRYAEQELRSLGAGEHTEVMRVKVRDRFGDYGLVGLTVAHLTPAGLAVDAMILSCRVLGRGVEHAMMRALGEAATAAGKVHLELPYRHTARNAPARAFADSVASKFRITADPDADYLIPVGAALEIVHRPGSDPPAVVEARRSDEKRSVNPSAPSIGAARANLYQLLASELRSGAALVAAIRSVGLRLRELPARAIGAETTEEAALVALWEELLGIQGLGVEDDFFALGGSSLLAARMFAEIERRFGVRLRMTAILEAPTVRLLAGQLQPNRAAGAGVLIELKSGLGRTLFLVHDGDGETLLYRNLASRMPPSVGVVGIEPRSLPGVPLAHDSIRDMAACYVDAMRRRQPTGPYLLGGMCAGGLIAYEMAIQLTRAGQRVELVAVLDAATPQASQRPLRIAKQRTARFALLLESARKKYPSMLPRWLHIAKKTAGKVANAMRWEMASRLRGLATRWRFRLLEATLKGGKRWPRLIPELTVREIYGMAESRYRPATSNDLPVLLVRATAGNGADTPYRDIYADEDLGWQAVVGQLTVVDVAGGHASMLQEPFVGSLGAVLQSRTNAPSSFKAEGR